MTGLSPAEQVGGGEGLALVIRADLSEELILLGVSLPSRCLSHLKSFPLLLSWHVHYPWTPFLSALTLPIAESLTSCLAGPVVLVLQKPKPKDWHPPGGFILGLWALIIMVFFKTYGIKHMKFIF